jgi:hypothetical protein
MADLLEQRVHVPPASARQSLALCEALVNSNRVGTALVRAPGRERAKVIRADPRRRAGLRATRDAVTVKLTSGNDRGRHHNDAAVTGDVRLRRSRPGPVVSCRSRYNPFRRNDAGNLQRARGLERVEG